MTGSAMAVHDRSGASDRRYAQAARTLLGVAGALLSMLGLVFAAGGILYANDWSTLYPLAGLGLIVSGALVAKRNCAGAWTYTFVMAATFGLGTAFAAGGSHTAPGADAAHFPKAATKGGTQ
jgi:hypothetical protein